MSSVNTHVPHILELSKKAKKDFLDSFEYIFFDCDGVVWMVVGTIPHTDEAINLLKDAGKKCKFISNNSTRSDAGYLEKFQKIGVRDVVEYDIIHPAKSIISYVKMGHLPADTKFYSICDSTANELFRKNGLNVETLNVLESMTPAKFAETVHLRGEKVDAVLCDINLNMNFLEMTRAILYLQQNDKCELIIGASDASIPLLPDLTIMGPGQIFDILAQQTKREPIKLGKPGKALCDIIKEKFKIVNPKRVLFVGDNLTFDIGFGKRCGFQTLLVLSGVSSKEDMLRASSENCPDFYADGVFDFIEFFKNLKAA